MFFVFKIYIHDSLLPPTTPHHCVKEVNPFEYFSTSFVGSFMDATTSTVQGS